MRVMFHFNVSQLTAVQQQQQQQQQPILLASTLDYKYFLLIVILYESSCTATHSTSSECLFLTSHKIAPLDLSLKMALSNYEHIQRFFFCTICHTILVTDTAHHHRKLTKVKPNIVT